MPIQEFDRSGSKGSNIYENVSDYHIINLFSSSHCNELNNANNRQISFIFYDDKLSELTVSTVMCMQIKWKHLFKYHQVTNSIVYTQCENSLSVIGFYIRPCLLELPLSLIPLACACGLH